MNQQIDFTYQARAKVTATDSPACGLTGKIEAIIYAYEGWPSDLLYLLLEDGDHAGKIIKVFAHRCEAVANEGGTC